MYQMIGILGNLLTTDFNFYRYHLQMLCAFTIINSLGFNNYLLGIVHTNINRNLW